MGEKRELQVLSAGLAALILVAGAGQAHASIATTQYSYDIQGGTVTRTEPSGNRIKYHYDEVNRLSKMEFLDTPSTPTYTYEYDLTSQLSRITSPESETQFEYDTFDRLSSITDFGETSPILRFSYDHKDRFTWIVYPGNGRVCYQYDADGRLTRVGRLYSNNVGAVCGSADEITDYQYDQRGRPSDINYPNGITRHIEYDQITGQIVEIAYKKGNGGLVFSDVYEYVPASRLYASITRTTPTSRGTTYYEYDTRERVKTVTEPDGRRTEYKYDAFGNRVEERILNIKGNTEVQPGTKPYGTYTYEYIVNSNRLSRTLFNGTVLELFSYDAAGRIVRREHAINGVTTYSYDDRGLLVGVTKPGYAISYTYDALGTRKTKTVNGVTTRYISASIFGLQRTLVEADSNMNILATYVHGGGEILKEEPSVIDRNHDLYYLTDGMLGSVRYSVDLNGKIQSTARYDTFGQRRTEQMGSVVSNGHYGYNGEMAEPETGLIFLRSRYYDPALGRFISVDPFLGRLSQPVTQNRYIYVKNNPLLYSDPTGLDTVTSNNTYGLGAGGQTKISADFGSGDVYVYQGLGAVGGVSSTVSVSNTSPKEGFSWNFFGTIPSPVPGINLSLNYSWDATQYHLTGDAGGTSLSLSERLLRIPTPGGGLGLGATFGYTWRVGNMYDDPNLMNTVYGTDSISGPVGSGSYPQNSVDLDINDGDGC